MIIILTYPSVYLGPGLFVSSLSLFFSLFVTSLFCELAWYFLNELIISASSFLTSTWLKFADLLISLILPVGTLSLLLFDLSESLFNEPMLPVFSFLASV